LHFAFGKPTTWIGKSPQQQVNKLNKLFNRLSRE